jgi:(5-formylfuran-3-yl)methyl phosphate synthase
LQLLVSVRDPAEVTAALEGGADIVDAKEPERGALGAVSFQQLRAIDHQVPDHVSLSVALGDPESAAEVAAAIAGLPLRRRAAPLYLKLGLERTARNQLASLCSAAVRAAQRHAAKPRLIFVEYADRPVAIDAPGAVADAVRVASASGILVDTAAKDGRTLFDWWSPSRLSAWIVGTRKRGLTAAVAGSLGPVEVGRVATLRPDVIGVRGAACAGGRLGRVDAGLVRLLRFALESPAPGAAKRDTVGGPPSNRSILK